MINSLNPFSIRKTLFPVIFILLLSGCSHGPEIIWDKWGVPHVYADDATGMYYSFGWAQMQAHHDLILGLYAQSRGRASEYLGIDYLESDKMILTFGIPELAESGVNKMDPEYRKFLDAFVQGMNDYLDQNRDSIDKELLQVYPVVSSDILAHTYRVIWLEFLGGEDIYKAKEMISPGSNAIALAPSKTTTGNAMLVLNPHLPWHGYFTWFEAQLNYPGFSCYGIALAGMPVLTLAFNNYLGWAHTVNPIDASDRYELTLKDDGYLFDGAVKQFALKNYNLRVREPDGSYSEVPFQVKHSIHGPVTGISGNKALAIRIAGLEEFGIFEQYHEMAAARNFKEFESAIRMIQNPMFNLVYADREGNIFYLFNGNIPVRKEGDFHFWNGTIDGSSSRFSWDKYHGYDELPKLFNPETGFVQNCNEPPWFCTYPPALKQSDYPPYFSSSWMTFRPQRSINLIRSRQKFSFDQLVDLKLNTGMETADRFKKELIDASSSSTDPLVQEAARVLGEWDGRTETDSRGAVLFTAWFRLVEPDMFIRQWDQNDPVATPSGLKDPKKAAELLAKAAAGVLDSYGSLDVPWGEVYRFRRGSIDYPANGGPGDLLGIFRTMIFEKDIDNKFRAVHGDTFHAVVEFADQPRAMVLLSYGNSSQPGSRHYGDQIQYLSEKKMRPALLTREDLKGNTEQIETLKYKH